MTNGLKWRIAVALLFVFLAGVAVGVFGTAHHVREVMLGHRPPHFRGRMAEHLRRELRLTPEQFSQVQPIVDRSADRLEQIRRETNQRVQETIHAAHGELAPYLTPEQRARLDEMAQRHHHALRDGPPPPP